MRDGQRRESIRAQLPAAEDVLCRPKVLAHQRVLASNHDVLHWPTLLCACHRSPSPLEHKIRGLYLLHLLVHNRIAEFHTQVELIPSKASPSTL